MHYLDIELDGIDSTGNEKKYKLSDFAGENIILYFYPEDDTPVCTQEAHEFRDAMEILKNYAKVIGVSKNNIEEHKEFQKKHELNYILLSDTENKLKQAFKDHDKFITNMHRSTFIIDKEGNIVKFWDKVDVDGHINEIFEYFKNN